MYDSCILLTIYRRHLSAARKMTTATGNSAPAPMWVEGTVNGTYIRRSLQTESWERAQELVLEIESADDPKKPPAEKEEAITIQQAVDEYLADAKARDLAESMLAKLDTIFRKQLLDWARSEAISVNQFAEMFNVYQSAKNLRRMYAG
jgi:integrase/recombinase XerD